MTSQISIEQMCRDLLEIAIRDGLVLPSADPQTLTAGDLAGMANHLSEIRRRVVEPPKTATFTNRFAFPPPPSKSVGELPPLHESGPIYPGM